MPILRIVSDSQLPGDIIRKVKVLGSILGYNDPRCIWVEVSDGLTQPDVMAVTVTVEKDDFERPPFEKFCLEVGKYLREAVGKSVEVVHPTEFGIHSICWCPTEEGTQIYGGGSDMDVLFLQVGGTIDKGYPAGDDDHGYAFRIGDPAFLSVIGRANLAYSWSQGTVMRKDSSDMTDEDCAAIRAYVDDSGEENVIITHGTDTIHKTAAALSDITGKTIVLTGAMLPEKCRNSDADFNLGMAIGAAQCLPHGVYIALYGEVKPWNEFVPR